MSSKNSDWRIKEFSVPYLFIEPQLPRGEEETWWKLGADKIWIYFSPHLPLNTERIAQAEWLQNRRKEKVKEHSIRMVSWPRPGASIKLISDTKY